MIADGFKDCRLYFGHCVPPLLPIKHDTTQYYSDDK